MLISYRSCRGKKNPGLGAGYLTTSCWSEVPRDPETIQATAVACGVKTLLLKTPHALVSGRGEVNLVFAVTFWDNWMNRR